MIYRSSELNTYFQYNIGKLIYQYKKRNTIIHLQRWPMLHQWFDQRLQLEQPSWWYLAIWYFEWIWSFSLFRIRLFLSRILWSRSLCKLNKEKKSLQIKLNVDKDKDGIRWDLILPFCQTSVNQLKSDFYANQVCVMMEYILRSKWCRLSNQ